MKNYFRDLKATLLNPTEFFLNLDTNSGIVPALIFITVTQWIGAAFDYLYSQIFSLVSGSSGNFLPEAAMNHPAIKRVFSDLQTPFFVWVFGVGKVILSPFFTVSGALATSLICFMAAQFFINEEEKRNRPVTFESMVRVIAYGSGPQILRVVPFVGPAIAAIWTFVSTLVGLKETYKIAWGKSFFIKIFPTMLMIIFFMMIGILLIIGLALGLSSIANIFQGH